MTQITTRRHQGKRDEVKRIKEEHGIKVVKSGVNRIFSG
jgi:hypothetical protein